MSLHWQGKIDLVSVAFSIVAKRLNVMKPSDKVQVLDSDETCPELPIVEGKGICRAVVWPGTGAERRSMHRISLAPGARTVVLRHSMEAVYYVMVGAGAVVDPRSESEQVLVEGSMVHVEPETAYRFEAATDGIELLGGPCPADLDLYRHLDFEGRGA